MPTNANEIIIKVRSIISTALRVDERKIELHSSIVRDLGAESIDFLDIMFRLEKVFNIRIPRDELFPEKLLTDVRFVREGYVTDLGLLELKKKVPNAHWDEFSKNLRVSNLGNFFTVGMIVDYLCKKPTQGNLSLSDNED